MLGVGQAENHSNMLSIDPWPPNQHAPLHLTPRDSRCNTRLRTRDSRRVATLLDWIILVFLPLISPRPKPIIDTIGEYLVSEIRLPYAPDLPELRPKRISTFPGAPTKEFCAVKQGAYLKLGRFWQIFCHHTICNIYLMCGLCFLPNFVGKGQERTPLF